MIQKDGKFSNLEALSAGETMEKNPAWSKPASWKGSCWRMLNQPGSPCHKRKDLQIKGLSCSSHRWYYAATGAPAAIFFFFTRSDRHSGTWTSWVILRKDEVEGPQSGPTCIQPTWTANCCPLMISTASKGQRKWKMPDTYRPSGRMPDSENKEATMSVVHDTQ